MAESPRAGALPGIGAGTLSSHPAGHSPDRRSPPAPGPRYGTSDRGQALTGFTERDGAQIQRRNVPRGGDAEVHPGAPVRPPSGSRPRPHRRAGRGARRAVWRHSGHVADGRRRSSGAIPDAGGRQGRCRRRSRTGRERRSPAPRGRYSRARAGRASAGRPAHSRANAESAPSAPPLARFHPVRAGQSAITVMFHRRSGGVAREPIPAKVSAVLSDFPGYEFRRTSLSVCGFAPVRPLSASGLSVVAGRLNCRGSRLSPGCGRPGPDHARRCELSTPPCRACTSRDASSAVRLRDGFSAGRKVSGSVLRAAGVGACAGAGPAVTAVRAPAVNLPVQVLRGGLT